MDRSGAVAINVVGMRRATIIDGLLRARRVLEDFKSGGRALKRRSGMVPGIAVVIVGDDPASGIYVGSKEKTARECGFLSRVHALPATASTSQILDLIGQLNVDQESHGILVQVPLPVDFH